MKPKVSAIIVNYKSPGETMKAVHSLLQSDHLELEIIVVDNASGPKSTLKLKALHDIRLIISPANNGFGAGCNLGAAAARGSYLLFVNPDVLVGPDTISRMIDAADSEPDLGAMGCKTLFDKGGLQPSAHRSFPSLWSHFYEYTPLILLLMARIKPLYYPTLYAPADYDTVLSPKTLLGAFMLISRERFNEVGGFDESFFLYREESDLCYALLARGYRLLYLPQPIIHHSSGTSTGNRYYANLDPRYMRSAYWFLLKRRGPLYTYACWASAVSGLSITYLCVLGGYCLRRATGHKGQHAQDLLTKVAGALRWHFGNRITRSNLAYRPIMKTDPS